MSLTALANLVVGVILVYFVVILLDSRKLPGQLGQYLQWVIRGVGFECEIKPTPKAEKVIRTWSIISIFVCALILSFLNCR